PEGGFYSAYDADSEGEEGKFYVWTPEEIRAVLGAAGQSHAADGSDRSRDYKVSEILAYYGVTEAGNFEGKNILHLADGAATPAPAGLDAARAALLAARAQRVPPGLDDKRLTSWNALAIAALAEAGAVLGRDDYLEAARDCAEFFLGTTPAPETG